MGQTSTVTMLLHGGPYDGDSFTGVADSDVGEPTEFSLMAGNTTYMYRVNSAGEWHYYGCRYSGSFVSVEEIDSKLTVVPNPPPDLKDVVRAAH